MQTADDQGRAIDHEVVIAGGGPTGMTLAAELVLAGIDVMVVERRPDRVLEGSRAGGLHSRTIELFDQRGIAERFVDAGTTYPFVGYSLMQLDIADFPTRHNYVLGLWQRHIERILGEWVDEVGVRTTFEREVVGFTQDADGVEVQLSDGSTLRAKYLVGCDGGRSVVREAAGIDFVGVDASTTWTIAEVEMDGEPEFGLKRNEAGINALERRDPDDPIRVLMTDPEPRPGIPTLEELRAAIVEVWGSDYGLREAMFISRFSDATRQAVNYRQGRVLLAGDAAHIHPPQGGQGLNIGVHDAMNLGWKLALVVSGRADESLLDTYETERHPIGARVLHNTMAQVALGTADLRHEQLRTTVNTLLSMDEPRRFVVGMVSGLDVRYPTGDTSEKDGDGASGDESAPVGHPLVGRRMPDRDLVVEGTRTRVAELLHGAPAVLLAFDGALDGSLDDEARALAALWSDIVRVVDAADVSEPATWALPVLGVIDAPTAVLVRPDGYVAWVAGGTEPLPDALTRSFGRRIQRDERVGEGW